MPIDISAGADTKFVATPRMIAVLAATVIAGYVWLVTNFVSKAEAQEITRALTEHITESTLYRLEADKNDADDKAWALEQQLQDPARDTSEGRDKLREYQRRAEKINESLRCIRAGNQNCTTGQ